MLNQLLLAGKLQQTAGIILADFQNCIPSSSQSFVLNEVLEFFIKKANRPTLKGLKIGHCSPNFAVPLGVNAALESNKKELIIEEGII